MPIVREPLEHVQCRGALVGEIPVSRTKLTPREIVVPTCGAERRLGDLERPTPRTDQRIEVDMIACHAPSVAGARG